MQRRTFLQSLLFLPLVRAQPAAPVTGAAGEDRYRDSVNSDEGTLRAALTDRNPQTGVSYAAN